jgi:thiamine-monophosphate kinase
VKPVSGAGPDGPPLLGDVGEDGLVRAVLRRYRPPPPFLLVPAGDDAAVLDVPGPVVLSTDTLVEGADFRRDWSGGHEVGVKLAAQNLADVAAMGARPLALLVSLAAPAGLQLDWATALADGLDDETARAAAVVAGGDVSQSAQLVLTGTALGVLAGPAVLRSGARPGEVVALAGRTGRSAAGLALLLAAGSPATAADLLLPASALVAAHLAPRPGYAAGPDAARAGATALIDTSDGLLRDAGRVARASGVVLDLDPVALTPPDDLVDAARALGNPALAREWVLTGGEDHALLACFPPDADLPAPYTVVGRVLEARGSPGVLVGGAPWTGSDGWHHFAGSGPASSP